MSKRFKRTHLTYVSSVFTQETSVVTLLVFLCLIIGTLVVAKILEASFLIKDVVALDDSCGSIIGAAKTSIRATLGAVLASGITL